MQGSRADEKRRGREAGGGGDEERERTGRDQQAWRSWLGKGAAGEEEEGQTGAGQHSAPLGEPPVCPRMVAFAFWCHERGSWSASQREFRKKESLLSVPSILPAARASCLPPLHSRFFACSPLHLHLFLVCFIICRCNPAPCHPHCTAPPSACSPVPPARTPFPIPRSQRRT